MTSQPFVVELEGQQQATVEAADAAWLAELLRRQPESTRLRIRYDDADTEGHAFAPTTIRVIADGDDTEGHALALHFPSLEEADAFRTRLLTTGVLVATVALGATAGIGLGALADGSPGSGATPVVTDVSAWSDDHMRSAADIDRAPADAGEDEIQLMGGGGPPILR